MPVLYMFSRSLIDDSRSIFNDSRSIFDDSRSIIDDSRSIFNDSKNVIDDSIVTLQLVASLMIVIYDCNITIV
jgi:hypothetical protein